MTIQFQLETPRLILRNLQETDLEGMFALDSDARVHTYLGGKTIKTPEEAANMIRHVNNQYQSFGIGRWAAIEKASNSFIGWSGLKYITEEENNRINFYDVGYRLLPEFWGKGYATESAMASLYYAFHVLNLPEVIGTVHEENQASRRALEKCGLQLKSKFIDRDLPILWLDVSKEEWIEKKIVPFIPNIKVTLG